MELVKQPFYDMRPLKIGKSPGTKGSTRIPKSQSGLKTRVASADNRTEEKEKAVVTPRSNSGKKRASSAPKYTVSPKEQIYCTPTRPAKDTQASSGAQAILFSPPRDEEKESGAKLTISAAASRSVLSSALSSNDSETSPVKANRAPLDHSSTSSHKRTKSHVEFAENIHTTINISPAESVHAKSPSRNRPVKVKTVAKSPTVISADVLSANRAAKKAVLAESKHSPHHIMSPATAPVNAQSHKQAQQSQSPFRGSSRQSRIPHYAQATFSSHFHHLAPPTSQGTVPANYPLTAPTAAILQKSTPQRSQSANRIREHSNPVGDGSRLESTPTRVRRVAVVTPSTAVESGAESIKKGKRRADNRNQRMPLQSTRDTSSRGEIDQYNDKFVDVITNILEDHTLDMSRNTTASSIPPPPPPLDEVKKSCTEESKFHANIELRKVLLCTNDIFYSS